MHQPGKRNATTLVVGASLLSLVIVVVDSRCAQAQLLTFKGFGPSIQYDQGRYPSVAFFGPRVVEVHNGTGGSGTLWYRVGIVNLTTGAFAWNDSYHYDNNGFNPSVALSYNPSASSFFAPNGGTVVEVHNGGAGAGPLVYRVGHLSGAGEETITWGLSQVYDYGNNPSVALCGNFVVEVHNGGADAGPLWYRLGWVSGSTITWGDSHQYDTGYNPSVSIFGTPSPPGSPLLGSFVFEAHNGGGAAGPMWFHYGSSDGSTITWTSGGNYDWGWNPKVAISPNDSAYLFEVHNGQKGGGPMWYHAAQLRSTTLLGPSIQYDYGYNPSVATGAHLGPGGGVWEVHNGGTGAGPLWYHRGN